MDTLPELGLCVFDASGQLLASSPAHLLMLKRELSNSIGHTWREWTPADHLRWTERNFQKALSGEPMSFVKEIEQGGGTRFLGRAQLFVIGSPRDRLVVGTLETIRASAEVSNINLFDIASYIGDLSAELSSLALRSDLRRLGGSLEAVSDEAARIAERLRTTSALH